MQYIIKRNSKAANYYNNILTTWAIIKPSRFQNTDINIQLKGQAFIKGTLPTNYTNYMNLLTVTAYEFVLLLLKFRLTLIYKTFI